MDSTSMTPADFAAISGNENGFGGGAWWIIILFLFVFMGGGGMFGNRATADQPATQGQMTDQFNFEALRQGQADVTSAIKDGNTNVIGVVKDVAYNNLTGIRDIEAAIAANTAAQDNCCCNILRANDQTRFDMANYTASINATSTANTQKILDAMCADKTAAMQNQINQLQLQAQLAGVVRYPMASTYTSGTNPFCGTCC